jgi:uncharacterized delta-60 repeat protein
MRNTTKTAAVIAAMAAIALAAGGSLDPTFGSGGVAWIDGGSVPLYMGEIAVQADGKIVAGGRRGTGAVNSAGQSVSEWVVRRLDAAGGLDAGFGTGGLVRLFGIDGGDTLYDLDLDPSGRIVATGNRTIKSGKGRKVKFTQYAVLVRWNANGSLDTSFGAGGVVQVSIPGTIGSVAKNVLLQPDGRLVIVGEAEYDVQVRPPGGSTLNLRQPFAARCLGNGSLDASFGSGGISVDTRVSDRPTGVWAAALQSTGHIVVGDRRFTPDLWVLTRFHANGAVDTGFGPPSAPDSLFGVAVDRFDRIVATGRTASPAAARVRRYLADGSADASFGISGVVTVDSYTQEITFSSLEFQPDDRIVFGLSVATVFPNGTYAATTVRLNDDGSLDSTYGTGGHGTLIDMGENNPTFGHNMDIAPDGRIVLAGPGGGVQGGQWFFARYDAD